jgi:hypothetical protein
MYYVGVGTLKNREFGFKSVAGQAKSLILPAPTPLETKFEYGEDKGPP